MMAEIIIAMAQIALTVLGYYYGFKLGYRRGIKDAEELFWKDESEARK